MHTRYMKNFVAVATHIGFDHVLKSSNLDNFEGIHKNLRILKLIFVHNSVTLIIPVGNPYS
jgi:hypothetical protein